MNLTRILVYTCLALVFVSAYVKFGTWEATGLTAAVFCLMPYRRD